MKNKLLLSFLFVFGFVQFHAQTTFGVKIQEISNDGSNYIISLQMQMMGDTPADFQLGSSSLQFTFPNNALSNPILESSPLVTPFPYFEPSVTVPLLDQCSFNIELSVPDGGTTIATAPMWTELGQINFTIDNAAQMVPLTWSYNGGTTQTVVYLDDEVIQIYAGSPNEDFLLFEPLEVSSDPVFTFIPSDITFECGEMIPIEMAMATTENEECEDVTVTFSDEEIVSDCGSTIVRTFIALDECENSSTVTQTISIVDTTNPVFTSPPADAVYECMEDVPVFEDLLVEDCTDNVNMESSETMLGSCPVTITRTWTATDACENSTVYVQTISVEDTTSPTFDTFPEDQLLPWVMDPIPAVEEPTYSDNCDDDLEVIFEEVIEQNISGGGTVYRTWTLIDDCGNEFSQTQTLDFSIGANIESFVTAPLQFSLFPNPTANFATLEVTSNNAEEIDITMFNVLGEIIFETQETIQSGKTNVSLDLSKFSSGSYLIKIRSNSNSSFLTLVKK